MREKYIDAAKIRQVSFITILVLVGWILFRELQAFIPAFLGALTLYVIMRKWMFRLIYMRKWKPGLAAMLLMLTSFLVIMLPIWLLANMLSAKVGFAIDHASDLLKGVQNFVSDIEKRTGYEIITEENLKNASGYIAKTLPGILGATFDTLTTIAMMYFILFFMLTQGRQMEKSLYDLLPMSEQNLNKVGKEVKDMVLSNAIGIPVIALLQGVVGLIGYLVLGVKEPLLWFAITCITAMLPVIGAAFAYVPLSIIFFAQGPIWKGIVMAIYGFGVIGTVDNVFRFALQKRIGNVHPLVTVLGVIIGINLFGFIGLIFGPLLIALFLLLVRIYKLEFVIDKKESPH